MSRSDFVYVVGLIAVIASIIAYGCRKIDACHRAGGVIVYSTCLKSESVIEVK